jgi:hypothetical protein
MEKAFRHAVQSFEGVLRSQHRVYDGRGEVARTQDVWGAEGISGRLCFIFFFTKVSGFIYSNKTTALRLLGTTSPRVRSPWLAASEQD